MDRLGKAGRTAAQRATRLKNEADRIAAQQARRDHLYAAAAEEARAVRSQEVIGSVAERVGNLVPLVLADRARKGFSGVTQLRYTSSDQKRRFEQTQRWLAYRGRETSAGVTTAGGWWVCNSLFYFKSELTERPIYLLSDGTFLVNGEQNTVDQMRTRAEGIKGTDERRVSMLTDIAAGLSRLLSQP